jgi:hypothetical protein
LLFLLFWSGNRIWTILVLIGNELGATTFKMKKRWGEYAYIPGRRVLSGVWGEHSEIDNLFVVGVDHVVRVNFGCVGLIMLFHDQVAGYDIVCNHRCKKDQQK